MASHPLKQETVHSVQSEARHIGYSFSDLIGTKTGNERPRKNFKGSRVRFFKSSEFSGLTNGFLNIVLRDVKVKQFISLLTLRMRLNTFFRLKYRSKYSTRVHVPQCSPEHQKA